MTAPFVIETLDPKEYKTSCQSCWVSNQPNRRFLNISERDQCVWQGCYPCFGRLKVKMNEWDDANS